MEYGIMQVSGELYEAWLPEQDRVCTAIGLEATAQLVFA